MTFENEEGINRAKNYDDVVLVDPRYEAIKTLLGEPVNFKDAAEPTDIIWENRHITALTRFNRSIVVVIIVTILLLISLSIIFFCSAKASAPYLKYP